MRKKQHKKKQVKVESLLLSGIASNAFSIPTKPTEPMEPMEQTGQNVDNEEFVENEKLHFHRMCYVCKNNHNDLHHFYPTMCLSCGDFNFKMRDFSFDLSGKFALVTGGRVKIGFEICLKLLRSGAHVIVTTRFPVDARKRFQSEVDSSNWFDRLDLRGVDFRFTSGVEDFCFSILKDYKRIDIIINNACQTIQKPFEYYQHLLKDEGEQNIFLKFEISRTASNNQLSQTEFDKTAFEKTTFGQTEFVEFEDDLKKFFPVGLYDGDGQQIDLRKVNSWNLNLSDVKTVELCEVMLVNAIAPFIINARLKCLLAREQAFERSYIVNVSAMEGQFYRLFKTTRHPHTNMAKAALNMMTRTSYLDYQRSNIYMTSVDTGWVTDEHPIGRRTNNFDPPLDCVDGAARVLHPIFEGEQTKKPVAGIFLKDYKETFW